jgi:hypothetical protein
VADILDVQVHQAELTLGDHVEPPTPDPAYVALDLGHGELELMVHDRIADVRHHRRVDIGLGVGPGFRGGSGLGVARTAAGSGGRGADSGHGARDGSAATGRLLGWGLR